MTHQSYLIHKLPKLLHERDAALALGVSVYWLQKQRHLKIGPNFCRVGGPDGRAVRYRESDLIDWISSNIVQHK